MDGPESKAVTHSSEEAARRRETHSDEIVALARRVQNLGDELHELSADVKVMIERGGHRDELMADLGHNLADIENGINDIKRKQNTQLSDEELKVLRAIMIGKDRSDWLKARSKYYFFGTIFTVGVIWSAREWVRAALVWVRILPS